jgi:hypothetical protein
MDDADGLVHLEDLDLALQDGIEKLAGIAFADDELALMVFFNRNGLNR